MSIAKGVFKIVAVFVIGIIGGIFADQIIWPYFVEKPLFYRYGLEQRPVQVTNREEITIRENQALQDRIEEVIPSVVGISFDNKEGSGFIATSDGLIVTLSSMAKGTSTVFYKNQEFKASLVKTGDQFTLLRINKNNLPTRAFADPNQVKLGQRVFLIARLLEKDVTVVNHGIVKYINGDGVHTNIFEVESLQGSPLLDIEGNVLGLTTIGQQGKVIGVPVPELEQLLE